MSDNAETTAWWDAPIDVTIEEQPTDVAWWTARWRWPKQSQDMLTVTPFDFGGVSDGSRDACEAAARAQIVEWRREQADAAARRARVSAPTTITI